MVALVVLLIALLYLNMFVGTFRRAMRIQKMIAPVVDPIEDGKPPDLKAIREMASQPLCRNDLFDALEEIGKQDLFPREFRTVERFAESLLASWLSHPNELQRAPDAIELIGEHELDSECELGPVRYFAFRYRIDPPSFAADRGWMLGVCGPFLRGADAPLVEPTGLFSELESVESQDVGAFVQRVHLGAMSRNLDKLRRAVAERAKGGGN